MKPVTYSWIGLSAAAPLIFLICIWVLAVYHSYRRYWRSVDLFLLAIFVQELLTALQVFVYALLSLMQPTSGILCGVFIWSMSATRALQAATVSSLLVDRALTSQWPYKYRFSVRRHQIRYHLVVLATMAALVGVAAILARPSETSSNFEECRFLPHSLHVRLALFLLSLYGILLVISAVSACVVQTTRSCRSGSAGPADVQDMTPITHGTTGSSTTTASSGRPQRPLASSSSTASSTSSGRLGGPLHSASSTTDLVAPPMRLYHNRGMKVPISKKPHRLQLDDFRWGASIGVALLCFIVNHIPYMCLLILGTFFPYILPEWPMENLSLWLSLLEGLLLPLLLGLCDPTFGEAAVLSCSRQRPTPSKYGEAIGPFRLGGGGGVGGKDEVKSFPLTNGSLFSSLQTMNIDGPFHLFPTGKGHHPMGPKMGILSQQDIRGMVSIGLRPSNAGMQNLHNNFGQLFYNPDGPSSLSSIERNGHNDPIYSDPLNKASSIDSSLKLTEDDHIYATLSETFSSMSSFSDDCLGDHHRCSSATTVANDDFEYHNPRSDVKGSMERNRNSTISNDSSCFRNHHLPKTHRPPAQLPPEAHGNGGSFTDNSTDSSSDSSPAYSFRSSTSSDLSDNINLEIPSNSQHEVDRILQLRASPRLGFFNEAFETSTSDQKRYFGDSIKTSREELNTSRQEQPKQSQVTEGTTNTLTKSHRNSSLSMNDLDRYDPREADQEEEMMFILPVKSESMLSLYRLYLAEDEDSGSKRLRYSVEVSRSESNLTELPGDEKLYPLEDCRSDNGSNHEIYQKKRVPLSAGSRIRRQHKIQRAKCVQKRTRPVVVTHTTSASLRNQKEPNTFWNKEHDRIPENDVLQLAVVDKMRRKNGIITIKDPSELSVEELFSVLGRASISQKSNTKEKVLPEVSNESKYVQHRNYPTTEYKKIFVSEYI